MWDDRLSSKLYIFLNGRTQNSIQLLVFEETNIIVQGLGGIKEQIKHKQYSTDAFKTRWKLSWGETQFTSRLGTAHSLSVRGAG